MNIRKRDEINLHAKFQLKLNNKHSQSSLLTHRNVAANVSKQRSTHFKFVISHENSNNMEI